MMLHYSAIMLGSLLLIYHQVTTWFPLFPWNDVKKYSRRDLFLEATINGVTMATAVVCLVAGNNGFYHNYPLIFFPLLLVGELISWWIPFFFGAKPEREQKFKHYFERTLKVIPQHPTRITPDANHLLLHALTAITTVVVYAERFGM